MKANKLRIKLTKKHYNVINYNKVAFRKRNTRNERFPRGVNNSSTNV